MDIDIGGVRYFSKPRERKASESAIERKTWISGLAQIRHELECPIEMRHIVFRRALAQAKQTWRVGKEASLLQQSLGERFRCQRRGVVMKFDIVLENQNGP